MLLKPYKLYCFKTICFISTHWCLLNKQIELYKQMINYFALFYGKTQCSVHHLNLEFMKQESFGVNQTFIWYPLVLNEFIHRNSKPIYWSVI